MREHYRHWLKSSSLMKLELGKMYFVGFTNFNKFLHICKLIRPTKCGYNFLKSDNTCFLNGHLYIAKLNKENCKGDIIYIRVSKKIFIKEI